MEDYMSLYRQERDCAMLTAEQVVQKSPAANPSGLKGALWSAEEVIVDPREAISGVAAYLEEQCGVVFRWSTCVNQLSDSTVYVGGDAA